MLSSNRNLIVNTDRRVKRLEVCPEMIIHFFVKGAAFECVGSDIPEDSEFRGIAHNSENNTWNIFISHPSFNEIPFGGAAPTLEGPVVQRLRA